MVDLSCGALFPRKPETVVLCEQKQNLWDLCGDCRLSNYLTLSVYIHVFCLREQKDFFCF